MKKLRVGILGCADIARRYSIRAFQALDVAEVVSIASRDSQKAKKWADEFGIPNAEGYEEMVQNPSIDAVYIPLPIGLHKEWIFKATAAGKHVISEKSLAPDFISVREIVDECRARGMVLYENFMCDFHPQHARVLSLIQGGAIGEPRVFVGSFGFPLVGEHGSRYRSDLGGGVLNEVGAYTVFMARKMMAQEPVSISANLVVDDEKQVDMRGTATLYFDNGKSALLAFDLDAVYQNNYSLWGSAGVIRVHPAYSMPQTLSPHLELVTNINNKEEVTLIDVPQVNHFELIFKDFCTTVLDVENNKEKIGRTYEKILTQARVLEAIRVSSREKRRVILD